MTSTFAHRNCSCSTQGEGESSQRREIDNRVWSGRNDVPETPDFQQKDEQESAGAGAPVRGGCTFPVGQ